MCSFVLFPHPPFDFRIISFLVLVLFWPTYYFINARLLSAAYACALCALDSAVLWKLSFENRELWLSFNLPHRIRCSSTILTRRISYFFSARKLFIRFVFVDWKLCPSTSRTEKLPVRAAPTANYVYIFTINQSQPVSQTHTCTHSSAYEFLICEQLFMRNAPYTHSAHSLELKNLSPRNTFISFGFGST